MSLCYPFAVRSTEAGWTDNEIRYDGLASRAEAVDSMGTTRYAWDGIRVLKLEDEGGTLKQRQVHGYAPIPSVGDMALMESADGDPNAPIADQVGTVVKVLGSDASVANSYRYDAFGVSRGVTESFANPFRFAGKPLDPDSVLYHFIARQYAAHLGRFAGRDRADGMEEVRSYTYVGGHPLSHTDPTGLWWAGVPNILSYIPDVRYYPGHRQLTEQGVCAFRFGPNTFQHLWESNVDTDLYYSWTPVPHFIARFSGLAGRLSCWAQSLDFVFRYTQNAFQYAERCRRARPFDICAGRAGIVVLGNALHAWQDMIGHRCVTTEEHKTIDPDNPRKHRVAWSLALYGTCGYLASYKSLLLSRGWTQDEISCCVASAWDTTYPWGRCSGLRA